MPGRDQQRNFRQCTPVSTLLQWEKKAQCVQPEFGVTGGEEEGEPTAEPVGTR